MERRYHDVGYPGAPLTVPCRHCASPNVLDRERIEITNGRAWSKCETCEDWYLVRWEDAVALGIAKPVDFDDSTD